MNYKIFDLKFLKKSSFTFPQNLMIPKLKANTATRVYGMLYFASVVTLHTIKDANTNPTCKDPAKFTCLLLKNYLFCSISIKGKIFLIRIRLVTIVKINFFSDINDKMSKIITVINIPM